MNRRSHVGSYVLGVLGLVAVLVAALELGIPDPDLSIHNHHIQHLFFVLGGSLWGLAIARAVPSRSSAGPGPAGWLVLAILAPVAVMFVMWPSTYPYIEAHPLLHALEHGVLLVLGVVTTYASFRFAEPAGWLFGASLVAMAWVAAYGYGVTPPPNRLLTASSAPAVASGAQAVGGGAAAGVVGAAGGAEAAGGATTASTGSVDGAVVFQQNCAACHQAEGGGIPGAFPRLAGHFPQLLSADGGRAYVLHVLLFGLQGSITVEGQTYNGVMPSWSHLTDAQIAAVLDHVATSWGDTYPSGVEPFTPADVAATRQPQLSAQQVHDLRDELALP